MALSYYIADTETTGLKPGYHEVIQVSIIRCSDGFQISKNIAAEFPERASQEALNVTGKKREELHKGCKKTEAVEYIENFFNEDGCEPKNRCIVAHNAPFDRGQLHHMWTSVGKVFPADLWMCTKEFTRKFAKKEGMVNPRISLDNSLKLTKVAARTGAHNAVIDTLNTYELWKVLMNQKINHAKLIKLHPHIIKDTL